MAERLSGATSPYLLQHADNPVDWWPWGDEAFAEARRRDVPVMLSVGYSACHWCHVMAHESFENAAIAELMNSRLVSIKVDREERPDVDAVYMTATQAMTGQGGWPMTVFLTHDREPFYCGTYYPPEHFARLVEAIASAWQDHRSDVTSQARQIAGALAESESRGSESGSAGDVLAGAADLGDTAVTALARRYDQARGGFGGAPKFPPSTVLEFLLRRSERAGDPSVAETALAMAAGTLEAMARGGMYDQLGGGFARYSVDAEWVVPHFEKMLYDNAQLARVYAHWWRRSGGDGSGAGDLARRVAQQTCDWMIADLRTGEGGFASALDADSEGTEGAFYVWTPGELADVLGEQDGKYAAEVFGVTAAGTFEHGRSVLQLPVDPAEPERHAQVRSRLLAARNARVWPARDDKIVAAWNGLAIGALAEAGLLFGRGDYIAAARRAAELIADLHLSDGRLARTSRDGIAGPSAGVLEDYACVADGLIALSGATGEAVWVTLAGRLLDGALERFRADSASADGASADGASADGGRAGGFYDTANDSEQLIYRPADPTDGPTPAGTFALAGALLSYAALTGSAAYREAAASALRPAAAVAPRYPQAAGWGLAVAEAFIAGPAEIAIIGPPDDDRTKSLHAAAAFGAPPGAVIALGPGDGPRPAVGQQSAVGQGPAVGQQSAVGQGPAVGLRSGTGQEPGGSRGPGDERGLGTGVSVPLLAGRDLVDGQPAAFVCRNFTCRLPVTTAPDLLAILRS